jgi:hypothetical protein
VSKLVTMLHSQGIVERTDRGQIGSVNRRRLIERWADDAPLAQRTRGTTWIAARGLTAFLGKLAGTTERYAVTGSLAASPKAPVAEPRLASVYVDDPDALVRALDLRLATAGSNVVLLAGSDDAVYEDTWEAKGVRYTSLVQVAADLISGQGREPAEGDALLRWMDEHEESWT